jgi:hypothetical protein
MCLFDLWKIVHVNIKVSPDYKAPEKGQVLQGVCKLRKQVEHHIKDCVEFLKWLHKKKIPFREGWTIRVVIIMSTCF